MNGVTTLTIGIACTLTVALAVKVTAAETRNPAPTGASSFIKRTSDGHPDWGGIWQRRGGIGLDPALKPGQIDRPPLTPAYQAKYEASLAALVAGKPVADPTASCEPPNGVRLMNMVYPMEIFQRPGLVAVFGEWDHQTRRIYTDGRKPGSDTERTYLGYSVGRWEGDELVAETTLFKGVPVLNQSGLTMSEDLVMNERWKQTGPDTLTDTITLTDAKALRAPYTYVKTFKRAAPDFEIMEYTCVENNRNPIMPDGTTGIILPQTK
ncbi:MAG: hypothetical protein ABI859_12470 [Pseudomonadota bacterium]